MNVENGDGDAKGIVSQTKLMVNYIPEFMSRDMIYALFSAMGKVDSCKLIANRGYGFIEYSDPEHAEKAKKAFNGMQMQGKTLKVSFALLNPENKVNHKPDTESNLYISNLPTDMLLDGLNAMFGQFGRITNSRVSHGIAFVCYETRAQAEAAITHLNGACPAGGAGPIVVKFANKPTTSRGPRLASRVGAPPSPHISFNGAAAVFNGAAPPSFNGGAFPASPFGGRAYPTAGYPRASTPPMLPSPGKALPFITKGQQRYNPMAAVGHGGGGMMGAGGVAGGAGASATQTTVYVYNVGEEADELALWQLFGPYGAIDSIKVIKDPETKKNKGFAFVNMREYEEAAAAIGALNGYGLHGQVLSVSFKTQKRH